MTTQQQREAMSALHQHLLELDKRIDENDDISRRALTHAFEAYSSLARLIAPVLTLPDVVFEEPDDE